MGKRVEVHGTGPADMNGKRGLASRHRLSHDPWRRPERPAVHGAARQRRGVQGEASERAGRGAGRRGRRGRSGSGQGEGQGEEGAERAQVRSLTCIFMIIVGRHYSDRSTASSRLGTSCWPWLCSFVLLHRRRSDQRPCERACASARLRRTAHTRLPRALSAFCAWVRDPLLIWF